MSPKYHYNKRKQKIAKSTGVYVNEGQLSYFPTREEIEITQRNLLGESVRSVGFKFGMCEMSVYRIIEKVRNYNRKKHGRKYY